MEYEKFLYKIHDLCLNSDYCKFFVYVTSKIFVLFVILTLPLFFYGNYTYIGHNTCLEPIISQHTLDVNSSMERPEGSKIIQASDVVNVRIREPLLETELSMGRNFDYAAFNFSGTNILENYTTVVDANFLGKYNFTQHYFVIDVNCYTDSLISKVLFRYLLSFNTVLMNEIITSMKGFDIYLKNYYTAEYFHLTKEEVESLGDHSKGILWPFEVFSNLLKILFGLFIVFTVTALSIRIFFQYLPMWLFLGTTRDTSIQREITRHYPWIGLYTHTLQLNAKTVGWMFVSLYVFQFVFARIVDAVETGWNFLLFNKDVPKILLHDFYSFVYFIELITFLFVRTRTSLKYLPRFSILLMLMFFYYVQHSVCGFYEFALSLLQWSIYAIYGYFIWTFETEALQWYPDMHYTPSLRSPRTLYCPVFSTTWIYDLPPIWTMFYPLFGRSYFSQQELAYVDENHTLLTQTFENANQRAAGGVQGLYGDQGLSTQAEIEMPHFEQGNRDPTRENLL